MIFIVRNATGEVPKLEIRMVRQTPTIVAAAPGHVDFFCDGDPDTARTAGWSVVSVHDGWYGDDSGGGMAIWGHGMFWEVRDTPFTVSQACGPDAWPAVVERDQDAVVNVRQAIFRG